MCAKCNTNDSNCMKCSALSPTKCLKCIDSFYLSPITFLCTKCTEFDQNCIICVGSYQCTKCKTGFYLLSIQSDDESSGVCEACSPSCMACKYNSQYCLSCKDGYTLSTNRQCLRTIRVKFSFILDAAY